MALVIESVSTGTSPITKPSGLAVGDLMVAVVATGWNGAYPPASTPSGWTDAGSGYDPVAYGLFWRVATSDDVAASNFTFQDTAANHLSGVLYRVSGYVANGDVSFGAFNAADTSGDANGSVATGITPAHDASHFFAGYIAYDSGGTTGTNGTYGLGGSPSFTERYDSTFTRTTFSVADAPISGTTALSNATVVTTATTPNDIRIFGILVYEMVGAVGTPTFLQATPQFYQTIPQMIVASPTIYSVTAALVVPTSTNTTKHAGANIVNTPKS